MDEDCPLRVTVAGRAMRSTFLVWSSPRINVWTVASLISPRTPRTPGARLLCWRDRLLKRPSIELLEIALSPLRLPEVSGRVEVTPGGRAISVISSPLPTVPPLRLSLLLPGTGLAPPKPKLSSSQSKPSSSNWVFCTLIMVTAIDTMTGSVLVSVSTIWEM